MVFLCNQILIMDVTLYDLVSSSNTYFNTLHVLKMVVVLDGNLDIPHAADRMTLSSLLNKFLCVLSEPDSCSGCIISDQY